MSKGDLDDIIMAGLGNDTVLAGGGDDYVLGGAVDTTIARYLGSRSYGFFSNQIGKVSLAPIM